MQAVEAEVGNGACVVLDQRSALSDASIPELCLALKVKIAQAMDSQRCVPTQGISHRYVYDDFNPLSQKFATDFVNWCHPIEKVKTSTPDSHLYIDQTCRRRSERRSRHASSNGESHKLRHSSPLP